MDILTLDSRNAFVLAINTRRSVLGPYMVEAYDQRRYFRRNGTRTAPMSEQQVRDAYMIAARGRELRPALWREHSFRFALPLVALGWRRPPFPRSRS
jgi:hypothetical protein